MSAATAWHSFGSTNVWGFSPAFDLLETEREKLQQALSSAENEDVNILLIGACDIRHVLTTVAQGWKWSDRKESYFKNRQVNFYIVEKQAPVIARHLLFLSLALDTSDEIGFQERVELFLELYGNTLIKEKGEALLRRKATELTRLITDGKGLLSEYVDISNLKFRERDDLEFTFNFWKDKSKSFDIMSLWEMRLRHYYGSRYDARDNVVDWDFHMKYTSKAPILHKREYNRWRESGCAFEVRDSLYDRPNRSLATVDNLLERGVRVAKWGYFGDIVTGPFLSFGIESENKELFKTMNGTNLHTSQDVAEFNINSLLYQLHHGRPYQSSRIQEITDGETAVRDFRQLRFQVHFLPLDLEAIVGARARSKFANLHFHRAYVGSSFAHSLASLVRETERRLELCGAQVGLGAVAPSPSPSPSPSSSSSQPQEVAEQQHQQQQQQQQQQPPSRHHLSQNNKLNNDLFARSGRGASIGGLTAAFTDGMQLEEGKGNGINLGHHLNSTISNVSSASSEANMTENRLFCDGGVFVESSRFVLDLTPEQRAAYQSKLDEMTGSSGSELEFLLSGLQLTKKNNEKINDSLQRVIWNKKNQCVIAAATADEKEKGSSASSSSSSSSSIKTSSAKHQQQAPASSDHQEIANFTMYFPQIRHDHDGVPK